MEGNPTVGRYTASGAQQIPGVRYPPLGRVGLQPSASKDERYYCDVHVPFHDWMLSSRRWRAIAGFALTIGLLSINGTAQPSTTRTLVAGPKGVDLNGGGKDEAIVYLTGRSWCGTAGCNTYVLTPDGESFRFVARVPTARTPIRVLDKISHGWHSIATLVREDATHIYEGELRFNGQKYPLGERPPAGGLPGRIVIPVNTQQVPLFPSLKAT